MTELVNITYTASVSAVATTTPSASHGSISKMLCMVRPSAWRCLEPPADYPHTFNERQVVAPLLEVLGELQALRLVVRGEVTAVDHLGRRRELLVDEAADDLPVLQNERHLVRSHLKHGARAG